MNKEVLEVCEWFCLETFSILNLRGVFREVENFYSYEFTLLEDFTLLEGKGTYPLSIGDFIKYKNEICIVTYVEQHRGFKVAHLQRIREVKE